MSRKMNAGQAAEVCMDVMARLEGASLSVLTAVKNRLDAKITTAMLAKVKRGVGAAATEAEGVLPGSGA